MTDSRGSTADLVVVEAKLWDGHALEDEALSVTHGRITARGSSREMLELAGPTTTVIDAGRRRLIPGLIDSHLHLVRGGRTWDVEVRWDDHQSLGEALEAISIRAGELGPGRWVAVVGGWHPNQFEERRMPRRADLDRAAPDNPVFVQRAYAESLANSRAMMEMGWSDREAPGGQVTGQPEMAALRARLSVVDDTSASAGTVSLFRELNRLGVTGAIDASGFGVTVDSYSAFMSVYSDGERGFRSRLLCAAPSPGTEFDELKRWTERVSLESGNEFVHHLGAGEIIDYGSHDMEGLAPKDITARLEPLRQVSEMLAGKAWPVHCHAILDKSIDVVLEAWSTLGPETLSRLRFTICHADQIGEDNLARVRDLGIGITIQNGMSMRGIDCLPTWGKNGITRAPPVRSMLDLGIPVAAGSDGTVACAYNPWRGVEWLVTGRSVDGAPPRVESERVGRDEALSLYTGRAAWFSFEEETRGNLATGSHADFALLSEDPLDVSDESLSAIQSVLTVVGGEDVHSTLG